MPRLMVAHYPHGRTPSLGGLHRVHMFGVLALNLDLQQATINGESIGLSLAEFAVVSLLASRPNVALSKDAILANLELGKIRLDARLVDVYVSRARSKLKAARSGCVIQTIPGRGYAMVSTDRDYETAPTLQTGRDPVPIAA